MGGCGRRSSVSALLKQACLEHAARHYTGNGERVFKLLGKDGRLSFGLIDKEIILKTQEWLRSLERTPCKVIKPSTSTSEQIEPGLVPALDTHMLWSVRAPC